MLLLQTRELAGGKAEDYTEQIFNAILDLAMTYSKFTGTDLDVIYTKFQTVLQSSISDIAPVNRKVNEALSKELKKKLIELHCNVHLLDGPASKARKNLKDYDRKKEIKSQIFGSEGSATNLLYEVSKLRHKNKGDPKKFKYFLKASNIRPVLIPSYVENRLQRAKAKGRH